MKVTFSNPRLHAEFSDWPSGSQRVKCVFDVEYNPKKGWRISRTTTGKPKFSTFAGPSCIVDGSDGKTYLLRVAVSYYGGRQHDHGFIDICRSDFLNASPDDLGREHGVFRQDEPELYQELLAIITRACATTQAVMG